MTSQRKHAGTGRRTPAATRHPAEPLPSLGLSTRPGEALLFVPLDQAERLATEILDWAAVGSAP